MNTKKVRLLAAEDSGYMLMALRAMVKLDPGIEIVGEAQNGNDAIASALSLEPDVITMDVNMPGLNGIEATREIMARRPTPIITLSSMTERGKAVTSQALAAGAVDFIPKSMSAADIDLTTITRQVTQKIRFWGEHRGSDLSLAPPAMPPETDLIVLAGGTGSPMAIGSVLRTMPHHANAPVLVSVDTLPAALTDPFTEYLGRISNRPTRSAMHRGLLASNGVFVVPGGRRARVENQEGRLTVVLAADPAVDLISSCISAAQRPQLIFFSGSERAVDGLIREASDGRVGIAVQEFETCVDCGMIEAVQRANIPYEVLSQRAGVTAAAAPA